MMILNHLRSNTVPYCTEMDFFCQYNSFMSDNPKRKLREKEGYIKSLNIAQTGKCGYIRSVGMTARNVEECKQRARHRAEQRQEHAVTGGAFRAQRASGPSASAPDPELEMDGIDAQSMTHKWFSCTVATPGRHMPTSFYTALRRWIDTDDRRDSQSLSCH